MTLFLRPHRPTSRLALRPPWSPLVTSAGSRGIKLSKLSRPAHHLQRNPIPRHIPPYGEVTGHGSELLNQLAQNGIGLTSILESTKKLSAWGIGFRLASQHSVSFNDLRYFTVAGHGGLEAIVRRCLSHHEERPLWANITARGEVKAIVRGKAANRISAALKQSLQSAGYNAYGRRMSDEDWQRHCRVLGWDPEKAIAPRRRRVVQLHGTVDIVAYEAKKIHQVSFADLRVHFDKVVLTLEEVMGRDEGFNLVSSPRDRFAPRPQEGYQRGRAQVGVNQRRPLNEARQPWQNRPFTQDKQGKGSSPTA